MLLNYSVSNCLTEWVNSEWMNELHDSLLCIVFGLILGDTSLQSWPNHPRVSHSVFLYSLHIWFYQMGKRVGLQNLTDLSHEGVKMQSTMPFLPSGHFVLKRSGQKLSGSLLLAIYDVRCWLHAVLGHCSQQLSWTAPDISHPAPAILFWRLAPNFLS